MPVMCPDVTCLINVYYIKSIKMQGKSSYTYLKKKNFTRENVKIDERLFLHVKRKTII